MTLPRSDWYVGSEGRSIVSSMEGTPWDSVQALVDFYYNLGALINLYSHAPSNSGFTTTICYVRRGEA